MPDEKLKERVEDYVGEVWEDVVADIRSLVRIRSVEDLSHATQKDPWGPASHEALRRALSIASRLGLDAHDCEGYLGYADVTGSSEDYLATIAHCDVVPEGLGWTVEPFDVTRKDAYLVGRGVLDDKGPLVLSLYAAHFFAREVERTGRRLPLTLRAIIGSEEETGMGDVSYYLDHYPQPRFVFTPDADFPLICGERGILQGHFSSDPTVGVAGSRIVSVEGGTVPNAICGLASAVVRAELGELPECGQVGRSVEGEGLVRLTAKGRGGHASLPEGAINAIGLLVDYLLDAGLVSDVQRPFFELEQLLCSSGHDGVALGVQSANDRFGALSIIGGTIRSQAGRLIQSCDVRYPDSTSADTLAHILTRRAKEHDASFAVDLVKPPFYADPSSPEVRCLLNTYDEYVGGVSKPFVIGGGTYAREFEHACAFGPHEPGEDVPAWVGPEHGPDEAVSEEGLRRALKIYIVSIARLMRLYA